MTNVKEGRLTQKYGVGLRSTSTWTHAQYNSRTRKYSILL